MWLVNSTINCVYKRTSINRAVSSESCFEDVSLQKGACEHSVFEYNKTLQKVVSFKVLD